MTIVSRRTSPTGRIALGLALALFAALGAESLEAQTLPSSEDCRACHIDLEDERLAEPARLYDADVHAETGFGCLACHGSAGDGHMDPGAGFLASPQRAQIPAMCGRCHSDAAFMRQFDPGIRVDQVTEYWTSGHGIALAERNDPGVATCTDCHQVHRIRSPSDPESYVSPVRMVETCARCHGDPEQMAGRDIGHEQVEEYTRSIHGRMLIEEGDVSAPVCNDCHGNHGAAPPGVSSVRNVCGQCHSTMAGFFDQSAHEEIFDREDLPGCATCHGKHAIEPATDEALGERSREVCQQCHAADDPNGQEFDRMALIIDSMEVAAADARHILEEAEDLGMEVSQALFELEDVTNAQHRARSAIHAFRTDPVRTEVAAALEITNRGQNRGEAALDEHRFRRVGLGLSSVIIFLLIGAILFKIRDLDDRLENLLGSLSKFFDTSIMPQGARPTAERLRLAACALLVEAAYADDSFSTEERDHLVELVRSRFGLVRREAEELLELAEGQRASSMGMGALAEMIGEHFSDGEKRMLLVQLWELVYSDGVLTQREVTFLEDIAGLLGMDPESLAATRREAAGTAPSGPSFGRSETP